MLPPCMSAPAEGQGPPPNLADRDKDWEPHSSVMAFDRLDRFPAQTALIAGDDAAFFQREKVKPAVVKQVPDAILLAQDFGHGVDRSLDHH